MSYASKYIVVFLSHFGTGMDGLMGFYIWWGEGFFGADGLDLARNLVIVARCIRIIDRRNSAIGQ